MDTSVIGSDLWQTFRFVLVEAMRRVGPPYFSIPRVGGDVTWSERPYCYELYHHLRCQLGDHFPYILHGELDKRHGEWMRGVFGEAIPDFVVHKPPSMDNFVVLEVKSVCNSHQVVQDDFDKLCRLTTDAAYLHGVLIIFGPNRAWLRNMRPMDGSVSVLWQQRALGKPAALNNGSEWKPLLVLRAQPIVSSH
jgi:hypothetical protein